MESVAIVAEAREKSGKEVSRKIRKNGRIPAIFYGPDNPPAPLIVNPRDLERIFSSPGGVNTLIELKVINPADQSEVQRMAILKDWQIHPVRRTLLHADLYEINVNRPIEVNVPLHFVGQAKAVGRGGMIEEIRRNVSVECLPTVIPDFIEVDVTTLDFGDSLRVRDLRVGEGIKITDDPDLTLVTVMAPKEEEAAPAPEVAEAVAEPEVIKQKEVPKEEEGE